MVPTVKTTANFIANRMRHSATPEAIRYPAALAMRRMHAAFISQGATHRWHVPCSLEDITAPERIRKGDQQR